MYPKVKSHVINSQGALIWCTVKNIGEYRTPVIKHYSDSKEY